MQADMYYKRLLKPVKQFFSCRTLYINCISVYKLFLSLFSAVFLLKYYRGESTRWAKRLGGKRPGGNILGAKRLGEEIVLGRNDPNSLS